jgi:hypothetical protein
MLDATELAELLVGLLCPALPFLVKVSEKVVEDVSADAVKALGKSTWDKAKNIWEKLSPQVQQQKTAQQAVIKFLQRPDKVSQFTLISEIRDILESNPALAQELLKLEQNPPINLQTGGVSIRGDFNNTGGNFVGGDQLNLGAK